VPHLLALAFMTRLGPTLLGLSLALLVLSGASVVRVDSNAPVAESGGEVESPPIFSSRLAQLVDRIPMRPVQVSVFVPSSSEPGSVVASTGVDSAEAARAFCEHHGWSGLPEFDDLLRQVTFAIDRERASLESPQSIEGLLRLHPRIDLDPEVDAQAPLVVTQLVVNLSPTQPVTLSLFEGESPVDAAEAFARRHNVTEDDAVVQIANALARQLEVAGPQVIGNLDVTLRGWDLEASVEQGRQLPLAEVDINVSVWSHVPPRTAALRAFSQAGLRPLSEQDVTAAVVSTLEGATTLIAEQQELFLSILDDSKQQQAKSSLARAQSRSRITQVPHGAEEDRQWVSASLVVAGQTFDLEFWADEGHLDEQLHDLATSFCKVEWELLEPLLAAGEEGPPLEETCAVVVAKLLRARAESVLQGAK
jgi:hypothetical protein